MINKVTLIGNLGKNPEVRRLENGTPVASFSLATNETWKDANGEEQKETQWHNLVCWRTLAESAEKWLKKGMLIYIEGKLSYREYEKDGVKRYQTDIVCSTFRKMEKSDNPNDNIPTTETQQRQAQKSETPKADDNLFGEPQQKELVCEEGKTYVVRSGVQKDKIMTIKSIGATSVIFDLDRRVNEMPMEKFNEFFKLMDEYKPFDGNSKKDNPDDLPF